MALMTTKDLSTESIEQSGKVKDLPSPGGQSTKKKRGKKGKKK